MNFPLRVNPKNKFLNTDDSHLHDCLSLKNWTTLNDTIMGGSSQSSCILTDQGLSFSGFLVEEGGGFISCKSPSFTPPIDLSHFSGIKIAIDGHGRTFKFAIACSDRFLGVDGLFFDRIKWVAEFSTELIGTSIVQIPLTKFIPTIRTKKVSLKAPLRKSSITQFQILYSKFGMPGELNTEFQPGDFEILLRSLNVYC